MILSTYTFQGTELPYRHYLLEIQSDIFANDILRDVSNRRNILTKIHTFEHTTLSWNTLRRNILIRNTSEKKWFELTLYWVQIFWVYTYKTLIYIEQKYFEMKYYWEQIFWAYYILRIDTFECTYTELWNALSRNTFEKKCLNILYIVCRYFWVCIYIYIYVYRERALEYFSDWHRCVVVQSCVIMIWWFSCHLCAN